jgi:hypothetical protein
MHNMNWIKNVNTKKSRKKIYIIFTKVFNFLGGKLKLITICNYILITKDIGYQKLPSCIKQVA